MTLLRRSFLVSLSLVALLTLSLPYAGQAQAAVAQLAPYRDIVWPDSLGHPHVLTDGGWFELTSIDGVPVAEMVTAARNAFGRLWQKRIDEDLVDVLAAMNRTPGGSVVLGLRHLETGEASERAYAMTAANRRAIMNAKQSRAGPAAPPDTPATDASVQPRFDIWLSDGGGAPRPVASATEPGRVSGNASLSADGRLLVFQGDADLLGEGAPPRTQQIWLYDVTSGAFTRVTHASAPGRQSGNPSISADGSRVVFESDADLLGEGIRERQNEIWLYEVASGALRRLTRSAEIGGVSTMPAISADGSTVAFASNSAYDDANPTNPAAEIWRLELATGALTRVTRSPSPEGRSIRPALDATGRRIAFESNVDVAGQDAPPGAGSDIWLYDHQERSLRRLTDGREPARASEAASISADGTRIVFQSDADLLREGRPDSVDEIWLYHTSTASLRRLTEVWDPVRDAASNPVLHPDTQYPRITADGSKVVFASDGDLLGEGLPNGHPHVWIHEIDTRELTRVDTGAGSGSGAAIDRTAARIALFRSDFDQIRAARIRAASAGPSTAAPPRDLTGEEVARDLEALQAEMEGRWAYLRANGVDYRGAIAAVRERGASGMSHADYGLEVLRIVSMFIDGHAGVGGVRMTPGWLPFFVESTGDRHVAVQTARTGFVDADHPYLTHLDGRPLAEWLAAAAPYESKASPQWVERNSLRLIRQVQFLREAMGVATRDSVTLTLRSEDGLRARELTLRVSASGAGASPWPATRSGLLEGDVGYLRLPSMDAAAVAEIATWMPRFRDTRGLIVDVRGNTGGSRDALRALFPFLMSESDPPRVVNAARYKLHPSFGEDHLGGSRFMYRESWPGWTSEERAAIERFRADFRPEWSPPEEEFSEWHYLVMSRRTNPDAFVYGKPVVVLLDPNSFSATDIFVSALRGWPGVTLVGTPSGGGSARQVVTQLPVSGLAVNLASMASFQWDGRLHDGNGTAPDVLVHPVAEYFLAGGRDNVLERALQLLRPVPE